MYTHTVALQDLKNAQQVYRENEYRELVYRAAIPLVDLAIRKQIDLTVAEALAVLLQSWNKAYYQFRPFTKEHLLQIEDLCAAHDPSMSGFRQRSIETCSLQDETDIKSLFHDFEAVLGPVGAAKSLHLLAPRFFPLWDNAIAEHYGLRLGAGRNADHYWRFMAIAIDQIKSLGGEAVIGRNPLKALDEYNYCKAKKWQQPSIEA